MKRMVGSSRVCARVTRVRGQGLNPKIRWIKPGACSCRNRKRFHNVVYFQVANLDLYPDLLERDQAVDQAGNGTFETSLS